MLPTFSLDRSVPIPTRRASEGLYRPNDPARALPTRRVNEGQRDGAVHQGLDERHAHYQPDAQTREPEVHPPLDGPGIFPSLARFDVALFNGPRAMPGAEL
jgi:hypothetical protein